jgi:hypothetical protein
MTADQFSAALVKLGFCTAHPVNGTMSKGHTEFAAMMGITDRTARRFASGESEVPPPIAMLLNLMLKTGTTPEKLKP